MLKNDAFWTILAYLPLFFVLLWFFYQCLKLRKKYKKIDMEYEYEDKIKLLTESESYTGECVKWVHELPGIMLSEIVFCPVEKKEGAIDITDMVMHLNDDHDWTFMEIADWLDSLPSQPTMN